MVRKREREGERNVEQNTKRKLKKNKAKEDGNRRISETEEDEYEILISKLKKR